MTSDELVYYALSKSGFPGHHGPSVLQDDVTPRWHFWRCDGGETYAEDCTYGRFTRYHAEIRMSEWSAEAEEAFERALSALGPYAREDDSFDEGNFVTGYRFSVCEVEDAEV